jgi:hypothetical protein
MIKILESKILCNSYNYTKNKYRSVYYDEVALKKCRNSLLKL